ncbi:hypothetical protein PsYK624_169820 [Phanerochaete sordida]|uniref:DUF6532 domain-containing protein n=1 Tax=Phanerochaete sordida TaxID=48140 RepID=A0A9P3GRV4_9APHY|nr:hypothetical protein PsYK624_169820 [Phanerochaete sordida]
MAPATRSRAKPAEKQSTAQPNKQASGGKSKDVLGQSNKAAGKRKAIRSPSASENEDLQPPKKKAAFDSAPASAHLTRPGLSSSTQHPLMSKTTDAPRLKPKSALEVRTVKPPVSKAPGSSATSAKPASAPVRQVLDFVEVPSSRNNQPSGSTSRPPNPMPPPAHSDNDADEDSIDEEARRQELARVTRQKLAQAAARKRLTAISAKYGEASEDKDSDEDAGSRLKVPTPTRTYGTNKDATEPHTPQRNMEPSQIAPQASKVPRPRRKVANDVSPQPSAVEQQAHQAEGEGRHGTGITDWADLNFEHDDNHDNEAEHNDGVHVDHSSAPCGHALSEPYEESERESERERNNDPPSDYGDDENADAQHKEPHGRKNKGKGRALDLPSDHDKSEDANAQLAKPRRRKHKGKGKSRARKPRARKPLSDSDNDEEGGAQPEKPSRGKGKGKQLDDDSTSDYEQSARDSSDDDSLANAMGNDDDDDLADPSINPQRLKRMLASEEVKLTVFDSDADEEDSDEDEELLLQPASLLVAKTSKAVTKLRAEEPLVKVDDNENNENNENNSEQDVSLAKSRSRTRVAVAARVAARSASAGPARAGPSNDAHASDASSSAKEYDPTANVPLLTLVYGRKGKIRITRLNPRLRKVVKLSYVILENDIYTIDAFPDTLKHNKLVFLVRCLKRGADAAKDTDIRQYISRNADWTREVISLLETRLSQLRGYVRALALAKVPAHYKLSNNPPDLDVRIEELLKGMRYIFSGDILTGYDAAKPFRHPCLSDIISLLLFKHRATFLKMKPDFFDDVWQGVAYKMVPGPLICLVATAIHSVIRDMGSPENDIWDFSSKKYSDVYTSHHNTMVALSDRLPGAVEFLFRATYDDASNGRTCKPKNVVESSLEYMDVDHMEVL